MCAALHNLYHFIQFSGQEISASPVRGFIGLNTLRREAVLLYDSVEEPTQQRILPSTNFSCSGNISKWTIFPSMNFSCNGTISKWTILPSMNFSCNGTISKWTFVARSRTGGNHRQYPQFQLWRPDGTGRCRKVYESSITSTLSGQSNFTVEEYTPNNSVPFEAGYILGMYQSEPAGSRRLSVVHVAVPDGYGYDNYPRMMSQEVFSTAGSNNYPLVAVNTSEYQKTLSDKQRCQPLSKNFYETQGLQYSHGASLPM